MEKDLIKGAIGTEGSYDLAIDGAAVKVTVSYGVGAFSAGLVVSLKVADLLLLLKDKIPGKIDDVIIDAIVAALDGGAVAMAAPVAEAPAAV